MVVEVEVKDLREVCVNSGEKPWIQGFGIGACCATTAKRTQQTLHYPITLDSFTFKWKQLIFQTESSQNNFTNDL